MIENLSLENKIFFEVALSIERGLKVFAFILIFA